MPRYGKAKQGDRTERNSSLLQKTSTVDSGWLHGFRSSED
jgi:hypothetical protein